MSDLISRMEVLNWLYSVWDGQITSLFPGINSLPSAEKAQLSEEDATKDATSGLIRRQDAIEAVEDTDWYHQNKKGEMVHGANPSDHQAWYKAEDIYNVLESLPSAEPKTPSNGSITSVKPENMHDRTMGDLISRQDAVDALGKEPKFKIKMIKTYAEGRSDQWFKDVATIASLPSVEPTIIRCRDCKHHDGIRCFRWNSTIITGFDDFCSNAEKRGEEDE